MKITWQAVGYGLLFTCTILLIIKWFMWQLLLIGAIATIAWALYKQP